MAKTSLSQKSNEKFDTAIEAGDKIVESMVKLGAKKNDHDKLDWSLLPLVPLQQTIRVFELGTQKYGRFNWRSGFKYSRLFAAMMRHAWAWFSGEDNDPESGCSHMAHVICCAAMMIEHQHFKLGEDDRPIFENLNLTMKVSSEKSLKKAHRVDTKSGRVHSRPKN